MEPVHGSRPVEVGTVQVGGGGPLALIAGPCVIESPDHCLMMAEGLRKTCDRDRMVDLDFLTAILPTAVEIDRAVRSQL